LKALTAEAKARLNKAFFLSALRESVARFPLFFIFLFFALPLFFSGFRQPAEITVF
jgi:hypothetical protein